MPQKPPIILLAPDSFKESLSSAEVCRHLQEGILREDPDINVIMAPIADGGEGTVDSLLILPGGTEHYSEVTGPLGDKERAKWGIMENDKKTAIIEMASAAGLPLLPVEKRNPVKTTTFGVGELILNAIGSGAKKIIVGLGGSATNDGGAGMLQALGFSLLDKSGNTIPPGNEGIGMIQRIDPGNVSPELPSIHFIAASDVQNPLSGPDGASFVYGPQKGASPEIVNKMDSNMKHFSDMVSHWKGKDWSEYPGAGAAGGLGFAFLAFLNAELRSGFETIAELTGLESKIKSADWVVTGEGKLDNQTLQGKGPHGVAKMAMKYKKPIIAVGGLIEPGSQKELEKVFSKIFRISPHDISREDSIRNAEEYLMETGRRIARYISGMEQS